MSALTKVSNIGIGLCNPDNNADTMRTRNRDTVTTQPGSFVSSQAVTTTAVADRYFRPTGQWVTGVGTYGLNPFPTAGSAYPSKIGVVETMQDEHVVPKGNNPCYHSKIVWNCPLVDITVRGRLFKQPSSFPEGVVSTVVSVGASTACTIGLTPDPLTETLMRSDEQLMKDAYWSAHPQRMGGDVNLLQEVGELIEFGKQLKRFLARLATIRDKNLNKNGRTVSELIDRIHDGLLGVNRELTIGDAMRYASELRLMFQLGLEPLADTANRLARAVQTVQKKLSRFNGARHRLHGVGRDSGTWTRVASSQ